MRGEGARQVVLRIDAVDAVCGVEVLDERDLEASSGTLARSNGGGGEEVLPDLSHNQHTILNIDE